MRPFGQTQHSYTEIGKYCDEKNFKYKLAVNYKETMNPVEFIDWITEYLIGTVSIYGDIILFNSETNLTTVLLMFAGNTSYGDKIVWEYSKNPNTNEFSYWPPLDGEEWKK